MRAAPRSKTTLSLHAATSEHLARYRLLRRASTTCTVEETTLERVHETLACRIPNEVVAYMVATERDPYELVTLTEEAEEEDGLPRRFVVLARDPESHTYHCIERTTVVGAPCTVTYWSPGTSTGALRSRKATQSTGRRAELAFTEYLNRVIPVPPPERRSARAAKPLDEREDEDAPEASEHAPTVAEPQRPELVLEIQPRSSVVGKRVRHRVYGEGSVVTERRDGRHAFEVEFPNLGRKVLLSSFVEVVDGPPETPRAPTA